MQPLLLQWGSTPLMDAAFYGHPEVAELLLSRGADKSKRHEDGDTALEIAQPEKGEGSAEAKAALAALLA